MSIHTLSADPCATAWHDISTDRLERLTIRDLILLLSRTEEQTRQIDGGSLDRAVTDQLLHHQHAILAELRRRGRRTGRSGAQAEMPGGTAAAR